MSENPPASHEKVSRWDRPKPPHDWRWVVGGVGRALIALGLMMFAFVAYQLWGTGIQTAQAQRSLSRQFEEQVAKTPPPSTTTTSPTTTAVPDTSPPVDTQVTTTIAATTTTGLPTAHPLPPEGEAVARLEIPRMNLNRIVVEGATADALTKGPGHFPETPLPGQLGNAAIAGHRTTHLHPFFDIDKLQPGDEIIATTLNGRYTYVVTGTEIVAPDDYASVIPTTDGTKASLTLVSCTPRYSATNRIVVRSELVAEKSDPLTAAAPAVPVSGGAIPGDSLPLDTTAPSSTPASTAPDTSVPGTTVPGTTVPDNAVVTVVTTPATSTPAIDDDPPSTADAFSDGWFTDTTAIPQAIIWGVVLALIAAGIYLLSRQVRRYWVGILAGFVPFLVVLYFFYENVNRLLPPNL